MTKQRAAVVVWLLRVIPSVPDTVFSSLSTNLIMEQSISLEETNKIRISLGLKPLTDDSAPADDKDKQAETNYTKQRDAEAKQKETKYVFVLAYIGVELTVFFFFQGDSRIALPSECYPSTSPCCYFYHFFGLSGGLVFGDGLAHAILAG
jgi:HIND motif